MARYIDEKEREKRGCKYCLDGFIMAYTRDLFCNHRKCPYRELDGYKSYEDFIKECDVYGEYN